MISEAHGARTFREGHACSEKHPYWIGLLLRKKHVDERRFGSCSAQGNTRRSPVAPISPLLMMDHHSRFLLGRGCWATLSKSASTVIPSIVIVVVVQRKASTFEHASCFPNGCHHFHDIQQLAKQRSECIGWTRSYNERALAHGAAHC